MYYLGKGCNVLHFLKKFCLKRIHIKKGHTVYVSIQWIFYLLSKSHGHSCIGEGGKGHKTQFTGINPGWSLFMAVEHMYRIQQEKSC